METLLMPLAVVQAIIFALINIIGTWYFVRVTSVHPRFPLPELSSGIEGFLERVWLALDWFSLLYLPVLLCGVGATMGDNEPAQFLRNFLYAWLISRIVVPVIAPEEDIPSNIGFFAYLGRRYEEFGRTLFMLPLMQILVFGLIAWIISFLLSSIGFLDRLQTSINDSLPFAGFPVIAEATSPQPQLTPLPAAALMAFAFIMVARLAPFRSVLHRIPVWKIFATLIAGVCLLGRTQLYSGIDYLGWPTWPTTAEFAALFVSVVLGTIPPLAIAFFTRRSQSFARA